MQPLKQLISAPLAPWLLSGWFVVTLVSVFAAFHLADNNRATVRSLLSQSGQRLQADVRTFVLEQQTTVATLAADTALRALVEERQANCAGECLSANSYRIAERLDALPANWPEDTRLFVLVDDQFIGRSRPNLPPALMNQFAEKNIGWLRAVPPPTTLGAQAAIRDAPVYFYASVGAGSFLIAEMDANEAARGMLRETVDESALGDKDRYLFDDRGVLLSRPRYTGRLVDAGVLAEPWPVLNVSLRDPGAALAGPGKMPDRARQPLIAPVAAALDMPAGLLLEPYRNYVGELSIAAFWFDPELEIGGIVETPAAAITAPVRQAYGAALLASLAAAIWLILVGRAIGQRDARIESRLHRSREELERADSMLGEARDTIEDEVTKRKQAFDEYARTQQSLAALLQAYPHGVLMFDAAGELLMVNRQFRMQWGVAAGETGEEAVFMAMASQLGRQLDDLEDVLRKDEVPATLNLENGRRMLVESWPASLDIDDGGRFLVFRETPNEGEAGPEENTDALSHALLTQLNLPVALVSSTGEIRLSTPAFDAFFSGAPDGDIHERVHPEADCPGAGRCSLLAETFEGESLEKGEIYRETIGDEYLIGVVPTVELFVESKHRRRPGMLNLSHLGWHLQKLWCLQILSRSTNHDFNNRISAIYGYSDLVEMMSDDADTIRESVGEIRNASEQGQILVQSYMGFARTLIGDRSNVKVGDVVSNAIQLGLLVKPFSIEVETEFSGDEVEIHTHENLLMQVIVVALLEIVSDLEVSGGRIMIRLSDEDGLRVTIDGRAPQPTTIPDWRGPEKTFNRQMCESILGYLGGAWRVTGREDGAQYEISLPGPSGAGDVLLLIGDANWADVLGESLERHGRAALAVGDVETARSVFENQPQMFGGVVIEGDSAEQHEAFVKFAAALSPRIRVIASDPFDTATDVLSRLLDPPA